MKDNHINLQKCEYSKIISKKKLKFISKSDKKQSYKLVKLRIKSYKKNYASPKIDTMDLTSGKFQWLFPQFISLM